MFQHDALSSCALTCALLILGRPLLRKPTTRFPSRAPPREVTPARPPPDEGGWPGRASAERGHLRHEISPCL